MAKHKKRTMDAASQKALQTAADNQVETAWRHEAAHDGWIRYLAISEGGQRCATSARTGGTSDTSLVDCGGSWRNS